MNARILKFYRQHRGQTGPVGRDAETALRNARVDVLWEALESAGLVRLQFMPDNDLDLSFLDQDLYQDTREGRANAKAIREAAERDGGFGVVGEFRLDPEDDDEDAWQNGDAVWGHVGYEDAKTSPYIPDIKATTIDALRTALKSRCPLCRQPLPHRHEA